MNVKKVLLGIMAILLFFVFTLTQVTVYAETEDRAFVKGQTVNMGIIPLMEDSTPHIGYAIVGNPPINIWNIVKYNGNTIDSGYKDYDIYCLRSGVGFTDLAGSNQVKSQPYDVFFDMKTQREDIKKQNEILKNLVEENITINGKTVNRYNAVLAILDRLYLPKESTEIEKKELLYEVIKFALTLSEYNAQINLIAEAFTLPEGVTKQDFLMGDLKGHTLADFGLTEKALTNNDISAVQQTALWYFTNSDEASYNQLEKNSWLQYTTDGNTYTNLGNVGGSSPNAETIRYYQADILYHYLINQAMERADEYANSATMLGEPLKIEEGTLTIEELNHDQYKVGPIKITKQNEIPYDEISIIVKSKGTEIQNPTFIDETGNEVRDFVDKNFYVVLPKDKIDSVTVDISTKYNDTSMTLGASSSNSSEQPLVEVHRSKKPITKQLTVNPLPEPFDLALRKYITKINGEELKGNDVRRPKINVDSLKNGTETTATYNHKKNPVMVENGSRITYEITIYNEGKKAGRATKIVDQLPTGLKFEQVISGNFVLGSYDEKTDNTLTLVRKENNTTNLKEYAGEQSPASETIEIECVVTAQPDTTNSKILTNVAWISEEIDSDGTVIIQQKGLDRDSEPGTIPTVNKDNMSDYIGFDNNKKDLTDSEYHYKGKQDDDDFEKLCLLPEPFDLKLIKRITAVNNQNVPERIEDIKVDQLNRVEANGNMAETTADYQLNKTPVAVKKGDIVTYTFRIYNEGTIDGYAQEITEDIPEGLQFLWSEKQGSELQADTTLTTQEKEAIKFNQDYLWGIAKQDENHKVTEIKTEYLGMYRGDTTDSKIAYTENLIKAFGKNDGTKTKEDLDYKEVAVKLKVVAENATGEAIKNEAAITEDCDKNGNPVEDRDSNPKDWKEHPNHEDDEDHDYIILQSFDLALRKFITQVENKPVNTRIPEVKYDKENQQISYEHSKEPVDVANGNTVIYTIRVYNEGQRDGYAAQVLDDIPVGLMYLPDNETNTTYRWKMYRKLKEEESNTQIQGDTIVQDGKTYVETTNREEAEVIVTDYLSKEQGEARIDNSESQENPNLLKAFRPEEELSNVNPDYKDVKVAFKVVEPNTSDKIIVNSAQIAKDTDENGDEVDDDDSIPGEWNEGEDDQDKEYIKLNYFDLALRKWVTQAIVIENGKETVTQTGHQPYDDPEPVVKVELNRKKLNQVTVKFRYSIRVINEGDIEGYAKEITDYVPEGLRFVAADNPGWVDEGNNVISTRLLENRLLKPGEYADVEVLLTWNNHENNMGVKTNTAEISEDDNEFDAPDRDSTPDNRKPKEDDIDDAPVMFSLNTGQVSIYFSLGFVILITIAGGVILIKKFVL